MSRRKTPHQKRESRRNRRAIDRRPVPRPEAAVKNETPGHYDPADYVHVHKDHLAKLQAQAPRIAELEAEVAMVDKSKLVERKGRFAAEAKLAAATALLETMPESPGADWIPWMDRRDAFLAGQPAAPYGTPDESPGFNAAWPLGAPKPAATEPEIFILVS